MFEKILSKVSKSLKKHKLPYMIIGGQAVLLYGEPRLTRDIEDVRTIIIKNPEIDTRYIQHWLKEFDESSDEKKHFKTFKRVVKDSAIF